MPQVSLLVDLKFSVLKGMEMVAVYEGEDDDTLAGDPLSSTDACDVAFRFHILASATPLTREEYIDMQLQEAERLRRIVEQHEHDADRHQHIARNGFDAGSS
jgi:hypothetical protein